MKRTLPASAMVILLTMPIHAAEPGDGATAALVDLNSAFIAAHAAAREINLAAGGPMILLRDGQLVLVRNNTETAAPILLPEYVTFKTFAHLPVAIYLLLGPAGAGQLDAHRMEQLNSYRAKLTHIANHIEQIGLVGADLERQQTILTDSQQFLDGVMEQQEFSTAELHAYTRRMTPLIKANLAGAARSQLDAMHRQVMAWKQELTPDEWKHLRVAVRGSVLARDDNLAKQYFARLLGIDGEGLRLTYMELYFPPTPMETLLATRSVDRGIGVAIFGDPDRMFRDVLADAAAAHIKTMKFDESTQGRSPEGSRINGKDGAASQGQAGSSEQSSPRVRADLIAPGR